MTRLFKISGVSLLVFFLLKNSLFAQNSVFVITPLLEHASIGKYLEILEDKDGTLSVNDVISPEMESRFFIAQNDEPGFGFTSSVYWAKLSVQNPSNVPFRWYLEVGYPLIDYLDLYIPDTTGNFIVKKAGDHLPFSSRDIHYRNIIFQLNEEPSSQKVYLLRFQSSSSMNMPLDFWTNDSLLDKTNLEQILLGIFFGAMIIMIIYNMFLFFGFRDWSYIYYVLFLGSWAFAQLAINGLSFQYLWPNSIWWANINLPFFIFGATSSSMQFCRALLATNETAPRWDRIFFIISITFLSAAILSLLIKYAISIRLGTASGIIVVIAMFIAGFFSLKQRNRPAIFFITAWIFFMFGVVLFALKSFGLLPGNFLTNWSIQIGAFVLMVLFSIAVQDRVKIEKRDKYLAQKAAFENQQKLVQTLKESERVLEEKVNERTKELYNKNVTLKKSTEELQELANELDALDNIVKIINREIEFGYVINALLEQGLKLIPQAKSGAALIYNSDTEKFHFMATSGQDISAIKKVTMTRDEIKATFFHLSEEVEKGIYIIRKKDDSEKEAILEITQSKSILAMSISLEGQLAGFIMFDNNKNLDAFDHSDAQKLNRFRSHAISAFAKSRLLLEMKKVTDEIIKAQDQLVVQEKMASLGQLTAGIAHEIKNPLNFVNNFAEGSVELTEELVEILDKQKDKLSSEDFEELGEIINDLKQNAIDIRENGKRADGIVRSMMDHARGSKGELRMVDINSLMEENINLAYHGYRAIDSSFNIDIEKNFDSSISPIRIVQTDVGRVMLNILNNACYAVLEKQKEKGNGYAPKLFVRTEADDSEVKIYIHDNGTGIPQKVKDKIFNPFFTTKPTGSGNTGLGLSISYDIIVQQHRGKLEVKSKPGEFTEFIITLPNNKEGI